MDNFNNCKINDMKLSPAQKKVIDTLKEGKKIHYTMGIYAKCFFADTHKNISWSTIFRLQDLGLIERGAGYITITELGKTIEL